MISDWLGDNIKGRWTIKVDGTTSDKNPDAAQNPNDAVLRSMTYAVRFAEKSDLDLFRTRFMPRRGS